MYLNKEYKWPRKKEFFKSFAKQTDIFTVLKFHDLASWKT